MLAGPLKNTLMNVAICGQKFYETEWMHGWNVLHELYGPDAPCRAFVCEMEESECMWGQFQIAINCEWVEMEISGDASVVNIIKILDAMFHENVPFVPTTDFFAKA